ncbi:hypothetical protein JCM19376_41280 [Fusibacter bizertensis]
MICFCAGLDDLCDDLCGDWLVELGEAFVVCIADLVVGLAVEFEVCFDAGFDVGFAAGFDADFGEDLFAFDEVGDDFFLSIMHPFSIYLYDCTVDAIYSSKLKVLNLRY